VLAAAEAVAIAQVCTSDAGRGLGVYLTLMAAGAGVALLAARSLSGSSPRALFLYAAALRATLLLGTPDLSDDLRRYVWDGRVAAAGISPYALAPADPALDVVARGGPRPPHADVRTVYPPAAQAVFRAVATLFPDRSAGDRAATVALRVIFAATDAAIVPLIFALGGANAGWAAALYAFHPLPMTESAGQGHLDSLGVLLLLVSLVYLSGGNGLSRGRRGRAGVAFVLSALTKYVPLAAAMPMTRKGRAAFLAAAGATGLAFGVLPRAWHSPSVPSAGGLGVFAQTWEFNSLLYSGLERGFATTGFPEVAKSGWIALKAALGHPRWMQVAFPYFYAGFLARAALALLLAAALLAILRIRDTETAVFASLAALLLASPTLHPWYLLWLLPFAARRRDPAVLWLTFAVPASYALLAPAAGVSSGAVLAFEYAPAALLFLAFLRRRRRAPLVSAA